MPVVWRWIRVQVYIPPEVHAEGGGGMDPNMPGTLRLPRPREEREDPGAPPTTPTAKSMPFRDERGDLVEEIVAVGEVDSDLPPEGDTLVVHSPRGGSHMPGPSQSSLGLVSPRTPPGGPPPKAVLAVSKSHGSTSAAPKAVIPKALGGAGSGKGMRGKVIGKPPWSEARRHDYDDPMTG